MTKLLLRLAVKNEAELLTPKGRTRVGMLSSITGMVCNIALCLVKLALGTLSGSIAVTADAFNNLSDVGSSVLTLAGFKLAAKPPDSDHPFGHGRIEYLSGLAVAFIILIVGVEIAKSSVVKIFAPEPVTFSWVVVGGLIASIFVKLWMCLFNRKLGGMIGSSVMQATAVDSLSDVWSTTATLVSVVAARFTTLPVDGVMGVIVAGFIGYAGYGVMKDTLDPLLGMKPDPELVNNISSRLLAYDGILGIHDLVVHDYGPSRRMASVHAEVSVHSNVLVSHDIIDRAERAIAKALGVELVVHMDPIETDCERTNELRTLAQRMAHSVVEGCTIHDFRPVCGGELTNFIFDMVVPFACKKSDDQLRAEIDAAFKAEDANYTAVVNIDRDYS